MRRLCLGVLVVAVTGGCGNGFEVARLREPARAAGGGLRVEVRQLQISDDIGDDGVRDDSEVVAELTLANDGSAAYELRPPSLTWLMSVDPRAPADTLSLPPAWASEGSFADEDGDGGYHLKLRPVVVPPGQTRSYWVVFRGYHFRGSGVPRRITLALPDPAGRRLELTLADPERGLARWDIEPPLAVWMLGVQTHALFGDLRAMAVATAVTRMARAGPLLWDLGFASRMLVQIQGDLTTTTSAFTGLAVNAHVTAPLWTGGRPETPGRIGVFVGGEAQLLLAIQRDAEAGMMPPASYRALAAELGVEFGLGAWHRAPTPFPLSPVGRPLSRLVTRIGYTHWWVGGGHSDGYTIGFRLAW
jgi:hypothetical protein